MTGLSRTYYVSAKTGSDQNDGQTPERAFASLFAVNHMSLQPGDRVLLERGSVFYGQYLQVTDSGSADAPIVIGAYGDEEEAAPCIEACGQGIWYQDYGQPLDTCLSWLCIIGGTAVRCPVHPCGRSGADEFGAGDHRRAVFTGR